MAKFFHVMVASFLIFGMGISNAFAKNFTIGISQYPYTLHPSIDSMMAKTYILGMVQRPITAFNADWEVECMLCTELPSYENGMVVEETRADGTTGLAVTFDIHQDAAWGDGTPISSRDVLFSWEVGKHPLSGVSNAELYAKDIVDITIINETSFTLHFDKVTCDYQNIADFRLLPEHLEADIFRADPKTYKEKTTYNTDPTNPGLYFGPYVISDVQSGTSYKLERNHYWWGKQPNFETVSIKIIENTAALSANLLSGDIDYIAGELGLMIEQAISLEKRLKKQKPGKYQVTYKPGLIYEHIDLRLDTDKFSNPALRQALLYATPRQLISDQLFEGKQPVAHSNINPLDKIYTDQVAKYPYNPAKAAEILTELGYTKNADGWLTTADGTILEIEQMTTAGNKSREMVQETIQAAWAEIGIKSSIENQVPRVLFGQTLTQRKFKDTVMYAWLSAPRNIPRTTLHSSMVPTSDNNYSGQNYTSYASKQMDQILDDLETVCEPAANTKLWHQAQEIYAQELPALPLYFRADSFIIPNGLTGIVPTGHQYPTTLWIENWDKK